MALASGSKSLCGFRISQTFSMHWLTLANRWAKYKCASHPVISDHMLNNMALPYFAHTSLKQVVLHWRFSLQTYKLVSCLVAWISLWKDHRQPMQSCSANATANVAQVSYWIKTHTGKMHQAPWCSVLRQLAATQQQFQMSAHKFQGSSCYWPRTHTRDHIHCFSNEVLFHPAASHPWVDCWTVLQLIYNVCQRMVLPWNHQRMGKT